MVPNVLEIKGLRIEATSYPPGEPPRDVVLVLDATTGQNGDRRMEKEKRPAGERKSTQLTPSSLHAEGGERQRPVSGPLQGTVNGKANSVTNEANKLMAMAGYSQPASSSTTKDGHLGARPKIPSAGHTNLRD